GVDLGGGGLDLGGRRRIGDEVALRQAHRAHVHADPVAGGVLAEHQLGGSPADVHDEPRSGGQVRDGADGAAEGERSLLRAADHLGGDDEDLPDTVDEDVPVGGIARRGGGDEAVVLGVDAMLRDQHIINIYGHE